MEPEEVDQLRIAMKAELRDRRRRVRRAMPEPARQARSLAIAERIMSLPEWVGAKTVMLFVSMRTEVQTAALREDARRRNVRIAVPRMNADRDDLEIALWQEQDELRESGMMFLEPPREAPLVPGPEIDVVVVPALAADERGYRIGYGKGFYDRLLPRLERALRVAVIFDFELVTEVPERDQDQRVDLVVTDLRTLRTARGD